jgi:hypothetical protein
MPITDYINIETTHPVNRLSSSIIRWNSISCDQPFLLLLPVGVLVFSSTEAYAYGVASFAPFSVCGKAGETCLGCLEAYKLLLLPRICSPGQQHIHHQQAANMHAKQLAVLAFVSSVAAHGTVSGIVANSV